jgi:hypothetical protein
MDFKNERLMMSNEEIRNRAKELLNENKADLITKYMFLEQQCKKQQEVINKAINLLNAYIGVLDDTSDLYFENVKSILELEVKEVSK